MQIGKSLCAAICLRLDTVDGAQRTSDVEVDQLSFGITVSF